MTIQSTRTVQIHYLFNNTLQGGIEAKEKEMTRREKNKWVFN